MAHQIIFWPRGQAVKTSPFHGGNPGSIPGWVTRLKKAELLKSSAFSFSQYVIFVLRRGFSPLRGCLQKNRRMDANHAAIEKNFCDEIFIFDI